ncbi:hypothetical protein HDV05_000982, partial [Chytridiales sp. JEL 0842]
MARVKALLAHDFVHDGRNARALLAQVKSDPEGTEELLDWVGMYADGEDTVVELKEFELVYGEGGRELGRLEWVERMLKGWDFEVKVPGAQEEEEEGLLSLKTSRTHSSMNAMKKEEMQRMLSTTSLQGPAYTAAIVYEVNLSVPKDVAKEYLDYLNGFTDNVIKTVPVGLHWLSEEGEQKAYFTVQYDCDSEVHLKTYLEQYQETLAQADQGKWKFLVTSRRVL